MLTPIMILAAVVGAICVVVAIIRIGKKRFG